MYNENQTIMDLLNKDSLFQTIDNVSEALLFGLPIRAKEKDEISRFIVSRHGKPHAYANTFAPTESDLREDLILFTGERIKTNAGKCHIAGEEACRILHKLNVKTEVVLSILSEAESSLQKRIESSATNPKYVHGTYCCKPCSCGLWLNLSSGAFNNADMLKDGLGFLKTHRDGKGRWGSFPYYYTLYVLNEIDPCLVREELRYAAPSLPNKKPKTTENKYELRRHYLCEQIRQKAALA